MYENALIIRFLFVLRNRYNIDCKRLSKRSIIIFYQIIFLVLEIFDRKISCRGDLCKYLPCPNIHQPWPLLSVFPALVLDKVQVAGILLRLEDIHYLSTLQVHSVIVP